MKTIIKTGERAKGKTYALSILRRIIKETGTDIRTKGRSNEEAFLRAVFFRICEDLTFLTLSEISSLVNRKHSQVIRSREIFEQLDKKYLDLYYCLVLDLTSHQWKAREHEATKLRNLQLERTFNNIKEMLNRDFVSKIDLKKEIESITKNL